MEPPPYDKKQPAKRPVAAASSRDSSSNIPAAKRLTNAEFPTSSSPCSTLEDALLVAVAAYLPDARDLTRLECTDRRWQRALRKDDASHNDSLWKKLCARDLKKYPHYESLALALDEEEWSRNHPRWGPDGTPPNLQAHVSPTDSSSWKWKIRYKWIETDVQRTAFHSTAEMESLGWCCEHAVTKSHAVIRGQVPRRCQVREGLIKVHRDTQEFLGWIGREWPYTQVSVGREWRYLWKKCSFDDDAGIIPGRQGIMIHCLQGHHYHPMTVSRDTNSGRWVISRRVLTSVFTFVSCNDKGTLDYEQSLLKKRGFRQA